MSLPVTIRLAVPDDYKAICELADLMDAPQREALPDRFRKHDGPVRLRDRTEKLMHDPDTFLAVAELGGRVAGVANCGLLRMGGLPAEALDYLAPGPRDRRAARAASSGNRHCPARQGDRVGEGESRDRGAGECLRLQPACGRLLCLAWFHTAEPPPAPSARRLSR